MHAAGHAFLAGAAGLLARSLAGPPLGVFPFFEAEGGALALASAGVVAAIVKLGGGALSSWAEARIASAAGGAVRLAVLDRVLALSPGHGDHTDRGADRLTALTSHVADVERGVAHGVLAEARAAVALVPLAVLLVALAPRLAGSAVIALAAFGLLAFSLRRAFKRAHARASASASALVAAADEAVRHAELWATYGAARRIRAHVAGIGRAIADESASVRVRAALLSSTSEVLGALALALVLLLAARGLFGVEHGTVVPFAIVFFMAYKPLRDLVEARLERAKGQAALEAALNDDGSRSEPAPATRKTWKPAPLVLENVVTSHGKHAPVSIAIPAGSIVALVGPTGVGKTSLLRAMLGLAPASGVMRWGDARIDANGVGPSERPFAWVPQDAPIVGDTLAINVGLGRADHSTLVCGRCRSAEGGTQDDAQVPDPAPYLERLGASHLTKLGDARLSRALSGGERQWIAVARALASGQPALLLDEPTSALDPASENKLLAALAALRGELTIVIVTHRPAPIAIADVVLNLRDLRERLEHVEHGAGAYDDLVAANELAVDDVRAGARGEA
jgi:ABC-type multidrug transport system fused ATPase/permease subunit